MKAGPGGKAESGWNPNTLSKLLRLEPWLVSVLMFN